MLKDILNLEGVKELKKSEQGKLTGGGGSCPTYDPKVCESCGGFSIPNGCCVVDAVGHACLEGLDG